MASTVAVTAVNPIGEIRQRKAFYHAGRRWVFYVDGTNLLWKTSLDAISWSAEQDTNVPAGTWALNNGNKFGIWFDKSRSRVDIVVARGAMHTDHIYYRSGTPNADGTIAWKAAWAVVVAAQANVQYIYCMSICVDSNGYAWITYLRATAGGAIDYPYVSKSGNNDGTWGVTPPGFPYDTGYGPSSANWRSVVVPMLSGKVAVFRALPGTLGHADYYMGCNIWDGTAWLGMHNVSDIKNQSNSSIPVIADGDDLHALIYNPDIYPQMRYSTRPWGGAWTPNVAFDSMGIASLAIAPDTHDLWAFYPGISYRMRSGGVWGAATLFEAEGASVGPITFYSPYSVLGVVWTTGSYTLRYGELRSKKGAGSSWEVLPLLS